MLIDARKLPKDTTIQADVCVIGSGPAGVSLAREFRGQGLTVALLESGGWDWDGEVQQLTEGTSPIDTVGSRRRQFGGNAGIWSVSLLNSGGGCRYLPFDEVDFDQRDSVPNSGWPITRADLDNYYARAQQTCKIGTYDYTPRSWEKPGFEALPLKDERVTTRMFQFGAGEAFTQDYRGELEADPAITIYLYATAVELETNGDASHVSRVRVASNAQHQFWVQAGYVALATGGMEAARLLLMSNSVQKQGLGNRYDLVGRYFMDHPLVRGGTFIPASPSVLTSAKLYDMHPTQEIAVMAYFGLSRETVRREGLLNTSMLIFPRRRNYLSFRARDERGVQAVRSIRRSIRAGKQPLGSDFVDLVAGAEGIARFGLGRVFFPETQINDGGWSGESDLEKRYQVFEVFHQTEQAPHAENRITLDSERDALGCPKLVLNWRWHKIDLERILRAQQIFAQAIARSGLGRYDLSLVDGLPELCTYTTHHHMGTTRMHDNPRLGVVDRECQVHGVHNLFVASSSVFPTGSFANPTLTIVAMAIRVADQIKQRLAGDTSSIGSGSLHSAE